MTIAELAKRVNGIVEGDCAVDIVGVAALDDAVAGDVAFLADRAGKMYLSQVAACRASAILVPLDWKGEHASTLIRVGSPNRAFAQIAPLFAPPPVRHPPGIHPTAIVGEGVSLGEGCAIGAYAVVGDHCVVGRRCIIEAHVVLGEFCVLGDEVHLYPHVSVRERVKMGNRVMIHNGTVIGSDGYGYNVTLNAAGQPVIEKIQQQGVVELADDVEIGANVTIDRARFGATRIGRSTKIDNLVQIGHNVHVGECSGIIAQAGIAGSARIGNGVTIWSQSGVSGHIAIGDRSNVRPQSGVKDDVAPGGDVYGSPAVPKMDFARQMLVYRQVEKLKERIAELEARLGEKNGDAHQRRIKEDVHDTM